MSVKRRVKSRAIPARAVERNPATASIVALAARAAGHWMTEENVYSVGSQGRRSAAQAKALFYVRFAMGTVGPSARNVLVQVNLAAVDVQGVVTLLVPFVLELVERPARFAEAPAATFMVDTTVSATERERFNAGTVLAQVEKLAEPVMDLVPLAAICVLVQKTRSAFTVTEMRRSSARSAGALASCLAGSAEPGDGFAALTARATDSSLMPRWIVSVLILTPVASIPAGQWRGRARHRHHAARAGLRIEYSLADRENPIIREGAWG